jgi:site-specific recombinase XerD
MYSNMPLIERAGIAADLGIKVHAHMLRHACGYKLAGDGVDTRALQAYDTVHGPGAESL